jgi:hypothetical protein
LPLVPLSDSISTDSPADSVPANHRADNAALFAIAAAVTLLHLLTNSRYGFHRDELQFLSDARHMDWGFVAYPPLTAAMERISMELFGFNMVGLRLFSVFAQATAIIVTGLTARELDGRRLAQVTAALVVALSPLPLFEGTEFQYPTQRITTIIALGIRPEEADELFTNCRVVAHNGNSEGIHNEELDDHPYIFLCGAPRKPWSEVWKEHQDFG